MNAELQRIARRDKKDFLSDQCKEIEENNKMGKTRDVVKKIRDTQGAFHTKIGTLKDRKCMDLTSVRYLEEVARIHTRTIQKDLDNHDDVITHLEPDILECEVK